LRIVPGILACLLAGCSVQPPKAEANAQATCIAAGSITHNTSSDKDFRPHHGALTAVLAALAKGRHLRLGVEYLPPRDGGEENPVEPVALNRPTTSRAAGPLTGTLRPGRQPLVDLRRADVHTWAMNSEDLSVIRDPLAEQTLLFLDDLMGEDRRRLKRELGTPVLVLQSQDLQSPNLPLHADLLQAEDEAVWMTEYGARLLQRPTKRLLRRLPFVQSFELELDEFKSENVQFSEAWQRAHDRSHRPRLSVRLHTSDLKNPVELNLLQAGVRVGSSQERLKLGFQRNLTDRLHLEIRSRHDYARADWRLRADLSWTFTDRSSVHLVAGDDLDFLTTSTAYSLFESPMDGSPGMLLYAVHHF
jgi:hypothetical protein